jgi:hypothetical protein
VKNCDWTSGFLKSSFQFDASRVMIEIVHVKFNLADEIAADTLRSIRQKVMILLMG